MRGQRVMRAEGNGKENVDPNLPPPGKLAALQSFYFLTMKAIKVHGGKV